MRPRHECHQHTFAHVASRQPAVLLSPQRIVHPDPVNRCNRTTRVHHRSYQEAVALPHRVSDLRAIPTAWTLTLVMAHPPVDTTGRGHHSAAPPRSAGGAVAQARSDPGHAY